MFMDAPYHSTSISHTSIESNDHWGAGFKRGWEVNGWLGGVFILGLIATFLLPEAYRARSVQRFGYWIAFALIVFCAFRGGSSMSAFFSMVVSFLAAVWQTLSLLFGKKPATPVAAPAAAATAPLAAQSPPDAMPKPKRKRAASSSAAAPKS